MNVQKKYYPQLDAIRGLSFLAVFFFHAYKPTFGNSLFEKYIAFIYANLPLSIDVFFILSAFLLTLLGLKEIQRNENFSFKNYFVRRALRIWPLYFILMFVTFVIIKFVANKLGQPISLPAPYWYLLFIANYNHEPHVYFLKFLWTLSVEEQFYLLWGICLFVFKKNLKNTIFLLFAISIAFNIWGAYQKEGIYFNTLTYIFDMMAGAYSAYCLFNSTAIIHWLKKTISNKLAIFFYLFLIPFFLIYFFIDSHLQAVANNLFGIFMRCIFIIYCCFVILLQMIGDRAVLNLGRNRFLVYTGKISYGLYCFHGFVLTFSTILFQKFNFNIPAFLKAVLLLSINFLVASISYVIIEKPFLRLKEKLRRT